MKNIEQLEASIAEGVEIMQALVVKVKEIEAGVLRIANECNCRAEHGAEGAEHLLNIERMLRSLLKDL